MKKTYRIIAFVLVIMMSLSTVAFAAVPPPADDIQSSRYIASKNAAVTAMGGGTIRIDYSVTAYYTIDELGACQINLYKSTGQLMKTYYSSAYASMMGYNCVTHSGHVTYPGTVGTGYYAVIAFYAEDGGIGETKSISTGTTICT
ncbi:MAG: hypothetical protein Q4A83_06495 [Bacillota bacterium]|nr:hypothetical protein [Bacillota bacterium]